MTRVKEKRELQTLLLVGMSLLLVLAGCGGPSGPESIVDTPTPPQPSPREQAIAAAQRLYARYKDQGVDFSQGPCLSQEIIPDWAVDIAHEPRLPVDDEPENQCASYREGRVHHFVELDPEGKLIRAR